MKPVLQHRWRLEETREGPFLVYYGLRNPPRNLHQVLEVSPQAARAIGGMDGSLAWEDLARDPSLEAELRGLRDRGCIVDIGERRIPATPERHRSCIRCIHNDFLIPGLEFDERGLCAFCQCYERGAPPRRSIVEAFTEERLLDEIRRNRDSRFDAMILFTGGKDSSFLLWHAARRLGLRVLAAFWNMPYTHETARENIRRCIRRLPEVEFIEWSLPWNTVKKAMRGQWGQVGTPCLCPTAAFALFYPLAFQHGIPFILFGMEDVQTAVVDYVFPIAPSPDSGRRPPSHRESTLNFLKTRALPHPLRKAVQWRTELANYHASIRSQLASLFLPLQDIVARAEADPELEIPLVTRIRTKESYGDWGSAIDLLGRELDWRMPPQQKAMLHTSCRIEAVKDYVQYMRFKNMRTVFFPQSLVELSASVFFGFLSCEEALHQAEELGCPGPPEVLYGLLDDLDITADEVKGCGNEMPYALREALEGKSA